MKSPHLILVIGGGNGDCQTALLRGNTLQPVKQHSAASTCLYPRWAIIQQPQGSLVYALVKQGCDSLFCLVRPSVTIVFFRV